MDAATAAEFLELAMLFCFGFSWPFAIARTLRAKRVDGKSPLFSVLVMAGYLCGIAAHAISDGSWLVWVYLADFLLVLADFLLYCRYRKAPAK